MDYCSGCSRYSTLFLFPCPQALGEHRDAYLALIERREHARVSGKMRVLSALLQQWRRNDSRVLIFSRSTKMLDLLGRHLQTEQMPFLRLDGSTSSANRNRLVK